MTSTNTLSPIQAALATLPGQDFPAAAVDLLAALGYRSGRVPGDLSDDADDFVERHSEKDHDTRSQSQQEFVQAARSARLLFQVTDQEIAAEAQISLFGDNSFDTGNAQSFLFAAVVLHGDSYPRGRYAAFAREVNKLFPMPTVVLFKASSDLLTLAFVHRRPNRRDPSRDVLGSVSLIREIDPANPHRAHLDILEELSLGERLAWMKQHGQQQNFDGLLAAWLAALDTEELNKRFYRDLFGWFQRAVEVARFPVNQAQTLSPEEHVIRLITRLLFVWFIKEKGLVAEDLFVEHQVAGLLKDYDPAAGDSYYRAVLQNLFFATLNTEISLRGFSRGDNSTHRDFSRYRYAGQIADRDALLGLFDQTPFINGGLFDCLDSEAATGNGGYRIDCFTDNAAHRRGYSIPNRLFFDEGDKSQGLITLFNRYKFTVEENTPAEQEVALDPELLGKVFENLLAAYNPETRETARKQTGSYYTPRAVVDYMVDEALVASLSQKAAPANGDAQSWEERLRRLLDYLEHEDADTQQGFTDAERDGIVRAIAGLKALDPAVGSGAFPMGALHKLTLALRRLDPHNTRWEALQKELAGQRAAAAFDTANQQERDEELAEISETFERYRDSDFGRKLYLIQNSIYGVDIQPVATQIAKLRFFISLAIDQDADPKAGNFGIKPLPNLETRFVAANTLLGLGGLSRELTSERTRELQQQLNANRESHFHATTRAMKLQYRERDRGLRRALAESLTQSGLDAGHAAKVAQWDPYDQSASADWFDAEYMFGVTGGFDVVIANPPYIQLQKNSGELRRLYQDAGFATLTSTGDIYQLFYEKGVQLLAPQTGLLSYITSNSWLKAEYGKATRRWFAEGHTPLRLLEMGKDVFENAIVDTSILIARHGSSDLGGKAVDMDRLRDKTFPPDESLWSDLRPQGDGPWTTLSSIEQSVMDKMNAKGAPLKEWDVRINYGIKTGYNKAFIVDNATKEALVASDPKSTEILKPVLRGQDIQRFRVKWAGLWLIYSHSQVAEEDYPAIHNHLLPHREKLSKRRGGANPKTGQVPYEWWQLQVDYYNSGAYREFTKEKLFWMDMSPRGRFAYSDTEMYCNNKGFIMTSRSLKYLCAVLNSNIITWFIKNSARTTGMGLTQWERFSVERIPIPKISAAKQRPFIRLVDRILAAKAADPEADTGEIEEEIDWLVYKLYGLTEEESTAIERSLGLGHATDEA